MNEDYVLAKLSELMQKNIIPQNVLYSVLKDAILEDLTTILNEAYKTKKIQVHKTINQLSISIND